jgi:predicted metal-dependent phosphoesterase TrpH
VALTDHDTLKGVQLAQAAAAGTGIEIIPGVEISAEYKGCELHLLGYFVDLNSTALTAALATLCQKRVGRFREMVERLRRCGVSLDERGVGLRAETGAVGRRHLAMLLVEAGRVGSVREAFSRYLGDTGQVTVTKHRLAAEEAIALVRGAGGVASWAHPPYDDIRDTLTELRAWGLGAVEVDYPARRGSRGRALRTLAAEMKLAVTGGSDCHGPGNCRQEVGACGVTAAELDTLRQYTLR